MAKLGLQTTYQRCQSPAAIWLKTVFGLPGLPPSEVQPFFLNELMALAPNDTRVQAFASYLLNIYIGEEARFPPTMWAGIMDGRKRHTTNGCESWHRHFARGFVSSHPNMYDFLSILQMNNKRAMLNCQANDPTAMLNAAKLTAAMHNLKNDFDTNQIDAMTYVKLVSLNLMSAKRKRYIKRCSSIIKSIKQKYARKVTHIICRLGKQRLLP